MHIAIVLPHLKPGGTERTAATLANYLASRGDRVTLVLMFREQIFFDLDPKVELVQPSYLRSSLGKYYRMLGVIRYLRNVLRAKNADIVLALGYMAITLMSTLGLPSRVVISGRSSPLRVRFPGKPMLNALYSLGHRLLAFRVDGIIAQTSIAADRYRKRYRCPVTVVPNFLRQLQTYSNEKRDWIVTVGRCDTEKGQHYLLEAFSRLQAPAWSLVIVGDGPERARLESQAVVLGIGDRVYFAGFQKEVDKYLHQASIFAFTSLHEGFPNALLEALATPLPCVSFDCVAGPSDMIRDGENGFLVPVGDVAALSARLQQLVDNPALRMTLEQAAANTRSLHDIRHIGERYRNFFSQMINSSSQ